METSTARRARPHGPRSGALRQRPTPVGHGRHDHPRRSPADRYHLARGGVLGLRSSGHHRCRRHVRPLGGAGTNRRRGRRRRVVRGPRAAQPPWRTARHDARRRCDLRLHQQHRRGRHPPATGPHHGSSGRDQSVQTVDPAFLRLPLRRFVHAHRHIDESARQLPVRTVRSAAHRDVRAFRGRHRPGRRSV